MNDEAVSGLPYFHTLPELRPNPERWTPAERKLGLFQDCLLPFIGLQPSQINVWNVWGSTRACFFFLLSGWAVHKNRCAGRVDFVILSTSLQIGQYIMSSKRDREVCALCFSRWPPITAVHSFNLPRSDFLTSYHTRGQSVSVR